MIDSVQQGNSQVTVKQSDLLYKKFDLLIPMKYDENKKKAKQTLRRSKKVIADNTREIEDYWTTMPTMPRKSVQY